MEGKDYQDLDPGEGAAIAYLKDYARWTSRRITRMGSLLLKILGVSLKVVNLSYDRDLFAGAGNINYVIGHDPLVLAILKNPITPTVGRNHLSAQAISRLGSHLETEHNHPFLSGINAVS